MRVVTHPGGFHADDVFAIAALRLAEGDGVEVVRSRDADVQAAADVRIDVGGRNDPATGDFDHHQRGGAGERPNGIRYASFGLVWAHVGARVAGSEEAAAAIDERLVQGVDANDNGQTVIEVLVDDMQPMTVSGVVAALNPAWDEQLSPEEEHARFEQAVALATTILEREIAGAAAFERARQLVLDAIARAEDPRIVELDRNMPWRQTVVEYAPEALVVIYPKSDGWAMQMVPVSAGTFENRMDLPERWAGLTGAELVEATGVPGATFAHVARFYAAAASREAIMGLAQRALAAAPARSAPSAG